jgi:DNA repair protein RadC
MMGALYLDARSGLIGGCELFRGTLRRACFEPRLIFRKALLRDASGVLAFHTHPSGDPTPSAEDLLFTQRLAEIGRLMEINLVDHLILAGAQRWASMRQHGAW